jgi:ADP-heptose:LPS heptosyltransferase
MNPWLDARHILAVRLDNAGDVVMLGPALRAVKAVLPHARLTLLGTPGGVAMAPLLPWIDDTLVFQPVWQDLGDLPFDPAREFAFIRQLAERRFDAALIFTSFSQSPHPPGYVCYLAGIPLRAGESKEFGGSCLTTALPPAPDELHQVERNLRLVDAVGFTAAGRSLEVRVPPEAGDSAPALLARAGLDPARPYILVHPGASAAARRYPPARMGAVAQLLGEAGWQVLVTGVAREAALLAEVRAAAPSASALCDTTPGEYAALIARAAAVVCNNTLPMHLADALRTPVAVLFAGTDQEGAWGPRDTPARLLRRPTPCAPCYRFDCPIGLPCLDIPPADVAAAVLALLHATAGDEGRWANMVECERAAVG